MERTTTTGAIEEAEAICRHPVTGRSWSFPITAWREVFAELEADNARLDAAHSGNGEAAA